LTVESVLRGLITAGVAVVGACAGFTHTHDAALRAGQVGWLAWADAVVVECMAVVAGFELAKARKANRPAGWAAAVLGLSLVIQLGCQVSGVRRDWGSWLFAALPALACLVIVKFWMHSAPSTEVSKSVSAEVAPVLAEASRVDHPEEDLVQVELPRAQPVRSSWPPAA
jgi:hypothetical protein